MPIEWVYYLTTRLSETDLKKIPNVLDIESEPGEVESSPSKSKNLLRFNLALGTSKGKRKKPSALKC